MEVQAARRDYLWCGLSLLLLLGMQLVASVLMAILMVASLVPERLFFPVTMVVSTVVGDLPPILLISRKAGIPLRSLFSGEHRLEKVAPGVLMMVGVSVASGYLALAIEELFSLAGIDLWTPDFTLPADMPGCMLMLLAVSILGPLLEELLFRGMLLRTFMRYGPRFAVFASAMLFAFVHGNLTQGIGTFFMGVLLALIAQRAGSILPTVMIHMFYNTFAMLVTTASELPNAVAAGVTNGAYFLFGIACIAYTAVRYAKQRPVLPPKSSEAKPFGFRRLFRSWPVDVFLALCFLMALAPSQM